MESTGVNMKKTTQVSTLAALVGALFVGGAAQAAGAGWTHQFYIGVHGGSADGDGTKYDAVSNTPSVSGDTRRTNWGVLGGVNFRNGPWLLGIEADYGYMSEDNIESNYCDSYSLSFCETNYNYHVRARVGYSVTKTIDLFVAAGYAGINARMYNLLDNYEENLDGYTYGAGADWAFHQNGVLRLEVMKDDYDGEEFGPNDYGMKDWEDLTIRAAAIFTF